jgi:hypothetical protein
MVRAELSAGTITETRGVRLSRSLTMCIDITGLMRRRSPACAPEAGPFRGASSM